MATATHQQDYVHPAHAALELGVPAAWLKAEAEAGRIPHLRAGRRLLVNIDNVREALHEREQRAAQEVRA